jgi:hypothetical protein
MNIVPILTMVEVVMVKLFDSNLTCLNRLHNIEKE